MNEPSNLADIFNKWLADNEQRISDRFECERANDWTRIEQQGIALDLWNNRVQGRVTAWSQQLAVADWPFADAEIIRCAGEEAVFAEHFVQFNRDLLDRWLSALEAHSISN